MAPSQSRLSSKSARFAERANIAAPVPGYVGDHLLVRGQRGVARSSADLKTGVGSSTPSSSGGWPGSSSEMRPRSLETPLMSSPDACSGACPPGSRRRGNRPHAMAPRAPTARRSSFAASASRPASARERVIDHFARCQRHLRRAASSRFLRNCFLMVWFRSSATGGRH